MEAAKQIVLYGADNRPIESRSIENPSTPLSQADDWLYDALGGTESWAGNRINRDIALTYAAVWRSVSLISQHFAKLPLFVLKYLPNGGKERDQAHPSYRLLRRKANREMLAFTVKQVLCGHTLLEGNGYAYIVRRGDGYPLEIVPLDPCRTYPVRKGGVLWYVTSIGGDISVDGKVMTGGELVRIPAENMLHIKGFGYNGLVGYNVIQYAKNTLGLGLAAAEFNSKFFKNGATPSAVLETAGIVKPELAKRIRSEWDRMYVGLSAAHRLAILSDGLTLKPFGHTARDSQLNELRGFEIRQVAILFGVPPHKVGDNSKSSYNSLEQENQSFLDDCLDYYLTSFEEECYDKLLSESEKANETHTIEFMRQALVRADIAARYLAYEKGWNRWLTTNEIRAKENLNPVDDGDKMQPLPGSPAPGDKPPADGNESEPDVEPETDDDDGNRFMPVLLDAANRVLRRVETQAGRAATGNFAAFIADCQEKNDGAIRAALAPCFGLIARDAIGNKAAQDAFLTAMFTDVRASMKETLRTAPGDNLKESVSHGFDLLGRSNVAGWIEAARVAAITR